MLEQMEVLITSPISIATSGQEYHPQKRQGKKQQGRHFSIPMSVQRERHGLGNQDFQQGP